MIINIFAFIFGVLLLIMFTFVTLGVSAFIYVAVVNLLEEKRGTWK